MNKTLLNTNEHCGQYVALRSAEDNTVVASGPSPADVLRIASDKGVDSPYLLYVPAEESIHIY